MTPSGNFGRWCTSVWRSCGDSALGDIAQEIRMKVHLVAICGTGMGALAGLLKEAGHDVKGSDRAFYSPMAERLQAWGIPTVQGFDPAHIAPDTDLVIVGNVCRRDNPEAQAALQRGLKVMSFPQALSEFFIAGTTSVVVAGTHGKTTTAA